VVATSGIVEGLDGNALLIGWTGVAPTGVEGVYGEAADPNESGGIELAGGYEPNWPVEAGLAIGLTGAGCGA